ncbi:MAG: ATP-dependent Clp protease ATP-binding subunit [Deltaproteobacteria bacterium]|nr:ATP-dependent Clp protease ATP-binding subunit [Deltaproteobacteria bacterium]
MQLKSNLKLKYCPMLDSFIKIREFSQEEIDIFSNHTDIRDKRSYQDLVIRETIPDFNEKILKLIHNDGEIGFDMEGAIDELYRMCIKVNPALNIYNISIPVQEGGTPQLHLQPGRKRDVRNRIQEIRGLEETLKRRIIGQDEAIRRIVQSIQSAKIGIKDPHRPVGCFIFAGQTGVGKTELAKAVAECLVGSEKEMIRVDCSEFSQPHEYAKLIGAPPGYVGYEDGGSLTTPLLKNPENVVLFDEIEKANSKLHNLLLQIMDEGDLTDNKGRKIPFHDAVVILTTNVGVEGLDAMKNAVGFTKEEQPGRKIVERETLKALEKTFRPEFLNRIDEIICFRPLGTESIRKIVRLLLSRLKKNLSQMKISIRFTQGVIDFISREGMDPRYGARPLQRAIKQYIEVPLTERILHAKEEFPMKVVARISGRRIVFVADRTLPANRGNHRIQTLYQETG